MVKIDNMRIKFSRKFSKQYDKAPQNIQRSFKARLELFEGNKYHPLLNNHALTGKLKACRSINITGDWRAVFEELDNGDVVFFIMIGTHGQLYK